MKNNQLTVAQIGCGYWGPNLIRNFTAQKNCWVKYVVDVSEERRTYVETNFPKTKAITDVETTLNDTEVDAVVIATPAASHFELAKRALQNGKHTFVEKPLSMSIKEADELALLASGNKLTLMVGHTFLYNTAVEYLKGLVSSKSLGEIYYIYAQRLNLGVIRSDVNAMWNLAPHDVSIVCHVLGEMPVAVSAVGNDYIQKGIEDVVFMNLHFPNKVQAHIHVSWLDPNKVRRITIVGSRKMVVYNDVTDDKITIYDKGIDRSEIKTEMVFDTIVPNKLVHRTGNIIMPKVEFKEPLKIEAAHFLDCIVSGKSPISGAQNGRNVVAVLAASQESLKNNGKLVTL